MATGKNVFMIGPGFIGWNVLDLLVAENYHVSALVRREAHAEGIKASGGAIVKGSLDDFDLIAGESAKADIVIHTATADHVPSVLAVIAGIRKKVEQGNLAAPPIFIHTSGTSVFDDDARGEFKGTKIYRDDEPAEVDAVADSAPHRDVDLEIVKARKELGDKAKMVIMTPPLIYGYNSKHDRVTIQIPTLARFAMKHGYAPHMGAGKAVESQIHVLDLARAYITILHYLESTSDSEALANPYFFCESTSDAEPSWGEVAKGIAESLQAAGLKVDPVPRTLAKGDEKDLFGDFTSPVLGLNSRSRAIRLRALGWSPREKSWLESFKQDELPALLREQGQEFSGYKRVGATK